MKGWTRRTAVPRLQLMGCNHVGGLIMPTVARGVDNSKNNWLVGLGYLIGKHSLFLVINTKKYHFLTPEGTLWLGANRTSPCSFPYFHTLHSSLGSPDWDRSDIKRQNDEFCTKTVFSLSIWCLDYAFLPASSFLSKTSVGNNSLGLKHLAISCLGGHW